MAALLNVRDVSLTLEKCSVLHDLELSIEAGEIHALIGANGSGKSSLAFMIMGCHGYTPASGSIKFDSHDISTWRIHERARAGISLAWQEPTRFEGLTVGDYLQLDTGWVAADRCLSAVGLDPAHYLTRLLDRSLSGGERKRIELAALLAMRPKLAMLDEPAAGIDALSLDTVSDAIRSLKQNGAAVLLITHQDDIAACADRASQMCAGQIVFRGRPGDVVANYRQQKCIRCDGSACTTHDADTDKAIADKTGRAALQATAIH